MLDKYVVKDNEKTVYKIMDEEAVVLNLKDTKFYKLSSLASFIWEQADG